MTHHSRATRLKLSKANLGKNNPNYGKHCSKATRLKISKALKGNTNGYGNKGKYVSRSTRLKLSKAISNTFRKRPSYRLKLSKAQKKRFGRNPKNHPMYGVHRYGKEAFNWKGGLSFEPYSYEFNKALKREIRKRDRFTCQLCGKRGKHVHHIDYNKRNNRPSNLCVLCNPCNAKVNANRKYWTRYFRKIVRKFRKARKIYTVKNLLS